MAWRRLTTEWLHPSLVARLRALTSGSSLTTSRMAEFSTVWGRPDRGLSSKSVSPLAKRASRALDSPDGSGVIAQSAVDVAGCCHCSNAATPFMEDVSSKLLLRN
ncbi:hypothetical protein RB195_013069 [Necator americanus]|uniref:Uncharacterized protein n=1 Tax=Necator americanus TaxID=51031 RepID=A0ABR1DUB8_NECAM